MKAALFDIDGVLLVRQGYFSEHIAKKQNVPTEEVSVFFKNEFRDAQKGTVDLKDSLAKYLPKWKWEGDADSFLRYWHTTDFYLNTEVLAFVDELRSKGVRCCIASGQDPYRGAYIREHPEFRDRFEKFFYSFELKKSKADPSFFEDVIAALDVPPEEILYFDDNKECVASARSLGIQAVVFTSISDLPNL